jgi:hypothetical protein
MRSSGLAREEAVSEIGHRGYVAAFGNIMLSTGLNREKAGITREEAMYEFGRKGHDAEVNNIMLSTGSTREGAASERGRRLQKAQDSNKTKGEIRAERSRIGRMRAKGPQRGDGKPPDWMVVVEVDAKTKIERCDPGTRCGQMNMEIAAQLSDWGAMAFKTAKIEMSTFRSGNETIFFVNGTRGD